MRKLLLVFVVVVVAGCATPQKDISREGGDEDTPFLVEGADEIERAQRFTERVIELGNTHDKRIAGAYADDAYLKVVTVATDGSLTRHVMSGAQMRPLIKTGLESARKKGEQNTYDCKYQAMEHRDIKFDRLVRVNCMRHSSRGYSVPEILMVGPTLEDSRVWKVYLNTMWVCEAPATCTGVSNWSELICQESKGIAKLKFDCSCAEAEKK